MGQIFVRAVDPQGVPGWWHSRWKWANLKIRCVAVVHQSVTEFLPPPSTQARMDWRQKKSWVNYIERDYRQHLQFNIWWTLTCVADYRSPSGMISSLIKNSMVSSSQSSTLLSTSSVSTPLGAGRHESFHWVTGGGEKRKKVLAGCSHLLLAQDGGSSVPGRSAEPSLCSDGTPPSWPFAYPPDPTHTHAKKIKTTTC